MDRAHSFAAQWGYQKVSPDLASAGRFSRNRPDRIASPNDTHAEIAIAAAAGRQDGDVRKSLYGRNATESEAIVKAGGRRACPTWSGTTIAGFPRYGWPRNSSARKLGKIFHYRAKFLQDWTISSDCRRAAKDSWRLDVNVAGSGVTGDLLAHTIDTAMWLNGPIRKFRRSPRRSFKERKHNSHRQSGEGWYRRRQFVSSAFQNGSLASFMRPPVTRAATSAVHA